jgi:hypothetical protein
MEQQAAKLVDVVHGERFDFAGGPPTQAPQMPARELGTPRPR